MKTKQENLTVGDLIEELRLQDPKAEIVLAGDAEGNNYHPLIGIESDNEFVVLWPSHEYLEF